MTALGAMVARLIPDAGFEDQIAFAKAAKSSESLVSQVIHGGRKLVLKRIEPWANALNLKGEARAAFMREAFLMHCPPLIRDDYQRLRTRVDKLERRVAEFEDRYQT